MTDPLAGGGTVLLDGAVGTELHRAGLTMWAPWWTTRALLTESGRAMLRTVHERYRGAGAGVVTAATFRCNPRALRRAGLSPPAWGRLVGSALRIARAAAPDAVLAASIAPVEDCYRPDLVPPEAELRAEHRWLARELRRAGAELFLIETMNTLGEARIALAEALAAGARAWVSFVCRGDARLLSGEPLAAAAAAVHRDGAAAVLVNCATPADTERALPVLRAACPGPIGAYPNVEDRTGIPDGQPVPDSLPAALTPAGYADLLHRWRDDYGLRVLGGCCGSTPAHITALRARLN